MSNIIVLQCWSKIDIFCCALLAKLINSHLNKCIDFVLSQFLVDYITIIHFVIITYVGYFADSDDVIPVRCQQFVDEIDYLLAPPGPVVGRVEAPVVDPGRNVFLLQKGIHLTGAVEEFVFP